MNLTAIILTLNEECHLDRCIDSLAGIASDILIVDSFSTDRTVEIGKAHKSKVLQNEFVNHATQFNWALRHCPPDTDWVLRIDADEYLTPKLAEEIKARLPLVKAETKGIYLDRRIRFEGKKIRFGGILPVKVLRIFRHGCGRCEQRWMDEHIKVEGQTEWFPGEIVDDNLNSLTWWTAKHNSYASREAVDILNLEYGFAPMDSVASLESGSQAGMKRWIKERLYARLPLGPRALVYFLYRYVVRCGFLDGGAGTRFHFLQGFWYRYLVDAKVLEVKRHMDRTGSDPISAIRDRLGIAISRGE